MKTTYKQTNSPKEELRNAIKAGIENQLGNQKEADIDKFIAKHTDKNTPQTTGVDSEEIFKNLAEGVTKYQPRIYQRAYFWLCQKGLVNPLNKYQKKLKLIDSLISECDSSMKRTDRKISKYKISVTGSEIELKEAKGSFQTVENFIKYYTREKEKQSLDLDLKKENQESLQLIVDEEDYTDETHQEETLRDLDKVESDYNDLVIALDETDKLLDEKLSQQLEISDIILDESESFSKNYTRMDKQDNKFKNLKLRKKQLHSARDDIEDYVDCHSNGDIYDINLLIRADSALEGLKLDLDELDEMTGDALSNVLYSSPAHKDQAVLDIEALKKKQYQGSHERVETAKKIISKF